ICVQVEINVARPSWPWLVCIRAVGGMMTNQKPENQNQPNSSLRAFVPSWLRAFSRLNARLTRTRPGSVLIIVIVLLLLLAILGAAYISTTRSARVASAQNVMSSNFDDMLNGISKACEGVIVDDLNDTFGNLRGNTANTGNTIVNRNYYQGEAGTTPPIQPNAQAVASPGPGYNYNPGDIVNDASAGNQSTFYTVPGTTVIPLSTNIAPGSGFQVLN